MREVQEYQQALVEHLKEENCITTAVVEQAFLVVPRHLFLPGEPLEQVYSDRSIVVRRDAEGQWTSSSSQPAIMAIMLEQLDLKPRQRVLEIGAGTGYNAALIASIVGPGGRVVTVDIQLGPRGDKTGCSLSRGWGIAVHYGARLPADQCDTSQ